MPTRRMKCVCFAVLVTGLVGALAAPATAGATPKLKVAKHPDGPFEQVVARNVAIGEKRVFYFKAKSTDDQKADATFEEPAGLGSDYSVKYKRNDTNITDDVQGSGYDFKLTPKAKRFTVTIKATIAPPSPGCLYNQVEASGQESLTGIDVNGQTCN